MNAQGVNSEDAAQASAIEQRFLQTRHELEIDKLFRAVVKLEGSDLHLKVGRPPYVRVNGTLRPMNRGPIDDSGNRAACASRSSTRGGKRSSTKRAASTLPTSSTSMAIPGGSA